MARFKLIPEVHLVLNRNDDLLMLRRFNTGYEDGKYSLVAGHVDGGESFASAMAREAFEEAGLSLRSDCLSLVHTMHRRSDDERVSLFFQAGEFTGEPTNKEPDKCDDLSWFAPDQLPDNTIPYIRFALSHIRSGSTYSEFGWN